MDGWALRKMMVCAGIRGGRGEEGAPMQCETENANHLFNTYIHSLGPKPDPLLNYSLDPDPDL